MTDRTNTRAEDAADAFLERNNMTPAPYEPGTWDNFAIATGKDFMGGGAIFGNLVTAPLMVGADKLLGTGTQIQDEHFAEMEDAVDYWTPDAKTTGAAGQIAGSFAKIVLPLMASGGNPAVAATTTSLTVGGEAATDLVRQGADTQTALAVGGVQVAANLVGFGIPFLGKTLAQRVGSGVLGNLAVEVPAGAASSAILDAQGYEALSDQYGVTRESLAVAMLVGGVFGGAAHLGAPRATPSQRNAVLTASNADHLNTVAHPSPPLTRKDAVRNVDNLTKAMGQLFRDEPVSLSPDDLDGFMLRPELRGDAADTSPAAPLAMGNTPESVQADFRNIAERHGATITSMVRPIISRGAGARSQHPKGTAADFRTKDKTPEQVDALMADLRRAGFEVIDERNTDQPHIHAELPPSGRRTYMVDADPRLEGETDKAYAKRVIDTLPRPEPSMLPDEPDAYFDLAGASMRPIDRLFSTKTPNENARGGATGLNRMAAAREGVLSKRGPLDVRLDGDGRYAVLDGNGTFTAAKEAGMAELPVRVVRISREALDATDMPAALREPLAARYEQAADIYPAFDKAVRAISEAVDGRAIVPGLKGVSRAVEKIVKDYKGVATQIKDLVRGTIEIGDYASAQAAMQEALRLGYTVKRNGLAPGAEASFEGYRDILMRGEIDGLPVELQTNYPEWLEAKGRAHEYYAKGEAIKREWESQDRDPTPEEWSAYMAEVAPQRKIYAEVEAATRARNLRSETGAPSSDITDILNRRGVAPSQARQAPVDSSSVTGMPSTSEKNVPGGKDSGSSGMGVSSVRSVSDFDLSSADFPVQGDTATVVTERGLQVPVRYAVVEAETLVTSHDDALNVNPAFPAELQPRDRARAASEQQIAKIANALNPELLAESPKAADGAPIVGQDKVVESGNARTIAVRRAYQSGKAGEYQQFLTDNAQRFGLDPAAMDGIEQPMLVRVALDETRDRAEFARQANESTVARMSATEQAKADAQRLPDLATLATNDDGSLNPRASAQFVRDFLTRAVSPSEQGDMMAADGTLSQAGVARIRNAVFAKAYDDVDLVAMLVESTDANVKNVLGGMLRAAPEIARLREQMDEGGRYPMDIVPDLVTAVRKFSQLRSDRTGVAQFLAQGDLLGDGGLPGRAKDLLRVVDEHARAPKRMAQFLQRYVDGVDVLGDPRQADMLGGAQASIDSVVARASEQTTAANAAPTQGDGLFNAAGRPTSEAKATSPVNDDNRAAYEAAAAMPDLVVMDEDGTVRPAAEVLAEAEEVRAQAERETRGTKAAVDCFLRTAA